MWNLQHSRGSVISMTTAEQPDVRTGISPAEASSRWNRNIPVALIIYTIAFIDRTNRSLALPHISRDLHLDPQQAGTVAGIFFWGYLALQIPGGHLAKHWSAKKFISVLLLVWALFAIGCGLARTYHELLWLRLLLGVAESGVYPATLILLSHWFSRSERARANAFWLLCLPGAVILASPFSGWMLDHWSWRVMLVADGSLPFLWLVICLKFCFKTTRRRRSGCRKANASLWWKPCVGNVPNSRGRKRLPTCVLCCVHAYFCWLQFIFVS